MSLIDLINIFRRATSPGPSADTTSCSRATTPTTDPDGRRQGHGRATGGAPPVLHVLRATSLADRGVAELVDVANQMTAIIADVREEFVLFDTAADVRATPPSYNDLARTLAAIRTRVGA